MSKGEREAGDAEIETLVEGLARAEGMGLKRARLSLVALGKSAVPALCEALRNSEASKVRWEAAKALGAIGDAAAASVLVGALEDNDADVAWLAAEALRKMKAAAWPDLLRALVERGSVSAALRRGAHHALWKQKDKDYDDQLGSLKKALEFDTVPESTPLEARAFLSQLEDKGEA
jgi:HEAT repeat protein